MQPATCSVYVTPADKDEPRSSKSRRACDVPSNMRLAALVLPCQACVRHVAVNIEVTRKVQVQAARTLEATWTQVNSTEESLLMKHVAMVALASSVTLAVDGKVRSGGA